MQIRQNLQVVSWGVRWGVDDVGYQFDTWSGKGKRFISGRYARFDAPYHYHRDTLLYSEELDQWT